MMDLRFPGERYSARAKHWCYQRGGFQYCRIFTLVVIAMQFVWFKRDLREFDHQPLVSAATAGEVVALYVIEPDYRDFQIHLCGSGCF